MQVRPGGLVTKSQACPIGAEETIAALYSLQKGSSCKFLVRSVAAGVGVGGAKTGNKLSELKYLGVEFVSYFGRNLILVSLGAQSDLERCKG
jgi:hypothetical protein